ncbi:HAMP domain-containing sensor histidine kinase [Pannus brasiliensis CCIBt3594]|uniref:histidine kinase n=1 Tax=Pannus brasiliensis CCIBt3594 TaxID=1427578 RepID=A0AAW9QLB1_9CHRO
MDDIDALKREILQNKLAYQSALALARWKSGFLGRTAHELRSPLSSLLGLHQLILADLCESPEEEREFIDRAYRSARKLLVLLDELITISKLESGNIPVERQPISLAELFEDLERFTRLPAGNRNLAIEILAPAPEITILSDFRWLSNALIMVIDAAIDRCARGTIRFTGESSDGDTVQISIELPCPVTIWQEKPENPLSETEEEAFARFSESPSLSPGFRWEMARNILAILDGEIEYREIPDPKGGEPITRIDCSLPRSGDTTAVPTDSD